MEVLEDRTLLAVSTTSQLIDAINTANSSGGATTITLVGGPAFDFTSPYDNTQNALPVITANITIVGNSDTIERDSENTAMFRLFDVAGGGSLTLQDVTLKGGVAQGNPLLGQTSAEGGAVYSSGILNLSGVTVQGNQAIGFDGANAANAVGGNGQDAFGGGLYVAAGSVSLSNDQIINNSVYGGQGGHGGNNSDGGTGLDAGNGGQAAGGGLYVAGGSVNLSNDTLTKNVAYGGNGGNGGGNIQHGSGAGGAGGEAKGGGLCMVGGSDLTLSKDILDTNDAYGGNGGDGGSGGGDGGAGGDARGGGLYRLGGSSLTLSNDILDTNDASSMSGFAFERSITLSNDILNNNAAYGGKGGKGGKGLDGHIVGGPGAAVGGGLLVEDATIVTLSNDTLSNNSAHGGKGDDGGDGGSETSPFGVVIYSDSSHGGDGGIGGRAYGGGLYVTEGSLTLQNDSSITLKNDTLSGNVAQGGAGGNGGKGSDSNGSNGGNGGAGGAAAGGGFNAVGGNYSLINDTLSGNVTQGGEGGEGGDAGKHTSIAGNGGAGGAGNNGGNGTGGGLYVAAGSVTLANTLSAENNVAAGMGGTGGKGGNGGLFGSSGPAGGNGAAGNASGPDVFGFVSNSDHDLIGDPSGSDGFSMGRGDILSPSFIGLGPLANNGGPLVGAPGIQQVLPTMALLSNSPALGAGDPSVAPATDQRGVPRHAGGPTDIGSVQGSRYVSTPLAPPPAPPVLPAPSLHSPPLLGFLDGLFGGVETVNGNGTETVVDRFFGITLFVSNYDSAGNLTNVSLFGINVTFLFGAL